jgi:hypothetical protein
LAKSQLDLVMLGVPASIAENSGTEQQSFKISADAVH